MTLLRIYENTHEGYVWCYVTYFDGKNKSIPYHKYLWESINSQAPKGYVIHHKDKNKLNNSLDNLELMTNSDHAKLHGTKPHEEVFIKLICLYCKIEFERRGSEERHNRKNKAGPFCGRSCAGKWSTSIQYKNKTTEKVDPTRKSAYLRPTEEIPHGTDSGYTYHKCRCDLCRKENTERKKKYNKSIKDSDL